MTLKSHYNPIKIPLKLPEGRFLKWSGRNHFPRFQAVGRLPARSQVLQGPLKAALANESESSESPASLSAVKRAEDSSVGAESN